MAIRITPQMFWDEVQAWIDDGRADDDSTDSGPYDEHDSPDELPAQLRSMSMQDAQKWVSEAIQLCPDLDEYGHWLGSLVYTTSLTDGLMLIPGSPEEARGEDLYPLLDAAGIDW